MKAMILCAGLGTRLRPWTEKHPKALVPVGGIPMLKRVMDRLKAQGFDEITLNVHHFADQIMTFIKEGGLEIEKVDVSDESELLLDTGGGILKAEKFLAADPRPFLVHNVDILSNAKLYHLMEEHMRSDRHVTLLVSDRQSDRKLVFDNNMNLKGWFNQKTEMKRPSSLRIEEGDRMLSFSGIYIMSPAVFDIMRNNGFEGVFPIMDFFLAGLPDVKIGGIEEDGLEIIDIGKPDTLHRANLSIQ